MTVASLLSPRDILGRSLPFVRETLASLRKLQPDAWRKVCWQIDRTRWQVGHWGRSHHWPIDIAAHKFAATGNNTRFYKRKSLSGQTLQAVLDLLPCDKDLTEFLSVTHPDRPRKGARIGCLADVVMTMDLPAQRRFIRGWHGSLPSWALAHPYREEFSANIVRSLPCSTWRQVAKTDMTTGVAWLHTLKSVSAQRDLSGSLIDKSSAELAFFSRSPADVVAMLHQFPGLADDYLTLGRAGNRVCRIFPAVVEVLAEMCVRQLNIDVVPPQPELDRVMVIYQRMLCRMVQDDKIIFGSHG